MSFSTVRFIVFFIEFNINIELNKEETRKSLTA